MIKKKKNNTSPTKWQSQENPTTGEWKQKLES